MSLSWVTSIVGIDTAELVNQSKISLWVILLSKLLIFESAEKLIVFGCDIPNMINLLSLPLLTSLDLITFYIWALIWQNLINIATRLGIHSRKRKTVIGSLMLIKRLNYASFSILWVESQLITLTCIWWLSHACSRLNLLLYYGYLTELWRWSWVVAFLAWHLWVPLISMLKVKMPIFPMNFLIESLNSRGIRIALVGFIVINGLIHINWIHIFLIQDVVKLIVDVASLLESLLLSLSLWLVSTYEEVKVLVDVRFLLLVQFVLSLFVNHSASHKWRIIKSTIINTASFGVFKFPIFDFLNKFLKMLQVLDFITYIIFEAVDVVKHFLEIIPWFW